MLRSPTIDRNCSLCYCWPRLFHSMRASRQTELQREFPLHMVCSGLGNSPRIAQQSYRLVTEDDFAKAAGVAKVMAEG